MFDRCQTAGDDALKTACGTYSGLASPLCYPRPGRLHWLDVGGMAGMAGMGGMFIELVALLWQQR